MEDDYKIFIDQLRDGKVEELNLSFPPDTLQVKESALSFDLPIEVKGEAYIAEDSLILHLDMETKGVVPCSICNRPVQVPIGVKGVYHAVPFDEIKTRVFDIRDIVRENILLEVPPFAECNGDCPERRTLAKYLKEQSDTDDEGFCPFKELK